MTVPTDSEQFDSSLPSLASSSHANSEDEGANGSALDSAQNSDSQWDDPAYVPEREFVLMPLFRRIGEMLGIRKNAAEVEYSYAPEVRQEPVQQVVASAPEPVASPLSEDGQIASDEADSLARHIYVAQADLAPEPALQDAQPLTAESVSHEIPERVEPEMPFEPVLQASTPPVEAREEIVKAPLPAEVVSSQSALERTQEPLTPVYETVHETEEISSPLYQEQEEAVAQQDRTHDTPVEQVAFTPAPQYAVDAAANEWRPEQLATEWEQPEAPALQRERAWRESEPPKQAAPVAKAAGPQLVSVSKQKSLPPWKRIDLARQFTPQRVAVLGAVAMAVLMILGISIARRPAASLLPEQQQARTIQSGGVTLTTHQRRLAPVAAPAVQRRTAAPARTGEPAPSASKPVARPQRAASYSEPDVVTHYYKKEKPSPIHQSTVAGVQHFSDME